MRGKENDPYKSGPEPTEEEIRHYLPKEMDTHPFRRQFIKRVIQNIRGLKHEEDYSVAQVMIESVRWLEENRDAKNFFLGDSRHGFLENCPKRDREGHA